MKIIKNTSLYETKKLKSLFCFIHTLLSQYEGRLPSWKHLTISVVKHKDQNNYSGWAYHMPKSGAPRHGRKYAWREKGADMHLRMGRGISLTDISQLFAHELMHSYGYDHSQFSRDPLTPEQMAKIEKKFNKNDLLVANAMEWKPPVRKDYEKLLDELSAQYSWMNVYVKSGYYTDMEIEVFDDRLDFEHFYDHWLYTYTDHTTTWCKAYKLALKLVKGDIQKELTENWTVGLNPEWEVE